MLYSQSLQWRLALRGSPARLSSSTTTHIVTRRAYSSTRSRSYWPTPSSAQLTRPVVPIASSSRLLTAHFTTSPARRKEAPPPGSKDDDPNPDVKAEVEEVDETAVEDDEPVKKSKSSASARSQSGDGLEEKSSAAGSTGATETSSGSGNSGGSSGSGGGRRGRRSNAEQSLQKPTIPEVYPQVLAIPISKRPIFPGFYKTVTIRDKAVVAAIQEMIKRGQPYLGAFLLKDENADQDTISSMDEVYDVGVFAQVTSAFPVHGDPSALTCVIYPHRRIRMTSLLTAVEPKKPEQSTPEDVPEPIPPKEAKEETTEEKQGDVVASFEESEVDSNKNPTSTVIYEPTAFLRNYKVSVLNVENLVEDSYNPKSPVLRALTNEIVETCRQIANLNTIFKDQVTSFSISLSPGNLMEEPAKLADFAAAVSSGELSDLQAVMEEMDVEKRLSKGLVVLKNELSNARLQVKISKDVDSKIQKRQREYFLMEQMRGIKRELGIESDGKDKLIEAIKEKATKLAFPDAVKKVFDEELHKLAHLETMASEFNVTRNYLDWLTSIPWGKRSAENFAIKHATSVLEEDHYGLKDVKDRILEFIAVGKLRGTVEGKILCFVGPPGVGKTSIAKSIARALNRQYYRFSVGGMHDVAEIKGHRRTYVGALPGRIIQALKKCQTENPLILIDEIDKLSRGGAHGDPASALLELLDPEQNNSFLDHYMDVPVDLSKVLFVCTANMTDTIPRPLLDRMEMIELSGYVADEKMAISERYLSPAAKALAGLKDADVDLSKEAIMELIKYYCRESGVRNLKNQIEKVYRKAALKIVKDLGDEALAEEEALTPEGKAAQEAAEKDQSDVKDTPENVEEMTAEKPRVALKVPDDVHVSITKDNLKDYVGPPVFTYDRLYDVTPPGVAMGLAWTSMGGAALYIESILESALTHKSHPGLTNTGNLKSVMKESATIAYSFAKSVVATKFPENRFFDKAKLHMHCPEGAVPKDGPSAGITMASALLSLAFDKPLDPAISMTGELTLTGKVLRIGGLREKTVAARRAGCTTIIFPHDNLADWLELPESIKEGIEGRPVKWYSEVFDTIFPDINHEQVSNVWKAQLAEPEKKGDKSDDE